MQHAVDSSGQRSGGFRRQSVRSDCAIDRDGLDRKTLGAEFAAEIAGTLLPGKIKKPRRRVEMRGDYPGEIVGVAAGRDDIGAAQRATPTISPGQSPRISTRRRGYFILPGSSVPAISAANSAPRVLRSRPSRSIAQSLRTL